MREERGEAKKLELRRRGIEEIGKGNRDEARRDYSGRSRARGGTLAFGLARRSFTRGMREREERKGSHKGILRTRGNAHIKATSLSRASTAVYIQAARLYWFTVRPIT